MGIYQWIDEGADKWPDKIALNTRETVLSYSKIKILADCFANSCNDHGLQNGDRILIYTKNSWEAVVSIFGSSKAGCTFVCINPQTPYTRLIEIIDDCLPNIIIADEPIELKNNQIIRVFLNNPNNLTDTGWFHFLSWINNTKPRFNEVETINKIATLIYTSGSTGKSKGIISSDANVFFATQAINKLINHNERDKVLSYLPVSFDYGLYQIFLTFSAGATLYLRESKMFAAEINDLILRENITGLPGLRSLFNFFGNNKQRIFPSIRYISNTGDLLPKASIDHLEYAFPNAAIFLMYGLSECKRVSILSPLDRYDKPNSVGLPLEGTSVEILDDEGQVCKPMVTGELYVSGPHVCQGYWNMPNESKKTFIKRDGKTFLKTGDAFYRDEDGYLYYVSRKDQMFKTKGFRIEPAEIENIVKKEFNDIQEVVVVGVPDETIGHKVGMFITFNSGLDHFELLKNLRLFCKTELEPWKRPEVIIADHNLPLTASGKIDRNKIITKLMNNKEIN